jgi:hypothetical protein
MQFFKKLFGSKDEEKIDLNFDANDLKKAFIFKKDVDTRTVESQKALKNLNASFKKLNEHIDSLWHAAGVEPGFMTRKELAEDIDREIERLNEFVKKDFSGKAGQFGIFFTSDFESKDQVDQVRKAYAVVLSSILGIHGRLFAENATHKNEHIKQQKLFQDTVAMIGKSRVMIDEMKESLYEGITLPEEGASAGVKNAGSDNKDEKKTQGLKGS